MTRCLITRLFTVALLSTAAIAQTPVASEAALRGEVVELRAMIKQLESRVEALEGHSPASAPAAPEQTAAPVIQRASGSADENSPTAGTTVNMAIDGYYGYNFNAPIGRANLLRAYDVSSNSFSLNQADLVLENAPDPAHGKRFGARLDLQFGQATQTLQGNQANEPRPEIYRNIFQAYGTYVIPVGNGLTVDFGKWSSSVGIEGNYTKDQINYSRSYWYDYLPFYHMGVRANYKVNDALSLNYWVTNGTQQTEAYNGFKDQLFGFVFNTAKRVSWTVNYYLGQEHPDVAYFIFGNGPGGAPSLQGVPFEPIRPAPKGRLHILDSYATIQATPKLEFALESDWVIERYQTNSEPDETMGGAAYVRRHLNEKFYLAGRFEYMNDRNGLFSGVPQSLKEGTLTANYKFGEGFMMFWEWRRDFSNQRFFYTDTFGILSKHQTTATVGMVWWFGPKQGAW